MKEKEGTLTAIGFRWPSLFVEWMQWTAYQSNRANQVWNATVKNRADSVAVPETVANGPMMRPSLWAGRAVGRREEGCGPICGQSF